MNQTACRRMKFLNLPVISSLCLTLLLSGGCGKGPRREGIGGGAKTPVSVNLLFDELPEKEVESPEAASGEKVTTFGTFKGQVRIVGTEAELKSLLSAQKQIPCNKDSVADPSLVVTAQHGLGNVFIYPTTVPNAEIPAASQEPVVIDRKNCLLVPHAVTLRVGQPLELSDSEGSGTDVRISSATKEFQATLTKSGTPSSKTVFQSAEPVPVPVTVHNAPWMTSFVLVSAHPWVGVSGPEGSFEIPRLPAGDYEFVVWHEKAGRQPKTVSVSVGADETAETVIEIPAASLLRP